MVPELPFSTDQLATVLVEYELGPVNLPLTEADWVISRSAAQEW